MTETEHQEQTCSRLEMAIQAIGASQAEICRDFGVSPSRLGNWLAGRHYPSPFFLARFCDRYGITMDWIYRGQLGGVAASLAGALWAASEASSGAPAAAPGPAPGDGKKKRGRKPKGVMTAA